MLTRGGGIPAVSVADFAELDEFLADLQEFRHEHLA